MDFEKNTHYINTDLLLSAPIELTSLARIIAPEHVQDAPISCLSVGRSETLEHYANFEAFGPVGHYETPEESINALLDAIEKLPESLRAVWQACSRRTVDIGYRSGSAPAHVVSAISLCTLARMQALGIDMAITVYSMAD